MNNHLIKRPNDCNVLIVDDEKAICDILKNTLKPLYNVTTCCNGNDAFKLIDSLDYDIVITDLKLPDVSGLDILSYAKGKDEFTEVIMITGYASVETATLAINLGVYSYLLKPLVITDLLIQMERAVASRLFHLKSISLMQQSDYMSPEVRVHLQDITSLYFFIRKLMLSLEIPEIMRITLEEANQKMNSVLCVISVNLLGFSEAFAMPSSGEIELETLKKLLANNQKTAFPQADKTKLLSGDIPIFIYKGRQGQSPDFNSLNPQSIPMMVTDRLVGTLTIFHDMQNGRDVDQNQFLYVFTSIVSSIIEHGYTALQARRQAKTDSLTGIANHRLFHETLEREIARANRKKGKFSLILIDIDNFKKINDTYGHQIGDAVIIDLTKRISAIIRTGDVLARYGGEEFGLILPESNKTGANTLAKRILETISSKDLIFSQKQIHYTVSIGLVVYDGSKPVTKNLLIAAADKALYSSKNNGKNRITIGRVQ